MGSFPMSDRQHEVAPPLLCIMGPTASGKTELAIALAQALDGELISVDSVLVYRGLDIGSAKPAYPHHLVDICDPVQVYSAAHFRRDAQAAIRAVRARGRRPILVGGAMLYYRALLMGLSPLPQADPALRRDLHSRARRAGWPALHAELSAVDPLAAARIHPNHAQRILRALEVYRLSGQRLSELQRADRESPRAAALCVALAPRDRGELHQRIERRFARMMRRGFLAEVRALHARGDLHAGLPAIRAVGYRQLWAYLHGEHTLEGALERGVAATRQLAKRQFTWLRKWPQLRWIYTDRQGRVVAGDPGSQAPAADLLPTPAGRAATPADVLLNYLGSGPM